MALPIRKVVMPSVLSGQPNGRLPDSLLTTIAMPGGGTAVVLAQCAPKWNACLAAAAVAGHPLSQVGDYRTFAEQEALFRDRYTTTYLAGRPTKQWLSRTWWQKPNTAVAATPGTSNHGVGLALDLCEPGGGSISKLSVDWLTKHAAEYGISAEIQSENWHWRPYDGDAMTPAVLAYLSPVEEEEDDMFITSFVGEEHLYGVPGTFVDGLPVLVPLSGPWPKVEQWIKAGVRKVDSGVKLNKAYWHVTDVDAWPEGTAGPKGDKGDAAELAPGSVLVVQQP